VSTDLVVARFNEDLYWLEEVPADVRILVRNKGKPLGDLNHPRLVVHTAQNYGREAETYLEHIIGHYHTLADWTVFAQGDPYPHTTWAAFKWLLSQPSDTDKFLMRGSVMCLGQRDWDNHGRLCHWGKWLKQWRARQIDRSLFTLHEWFMDHLKLDIDSLGRIDYYRGAIFGVAKEAIRSRPIEVYLKLHADLALREHPEEAYYMERMWAYLFCGPDPQKSCRFWEGLRIGSGI
jgi:hypothetical protein